MLKFKNFIDEYAHIIMAAMIAMSILMLVYATFYIYPFGNGSVLVLDLNGQYVSYFEGLRHAFYEGKSLFFSFSTTLGSEMLGLGAYYLFSPFSIIVLLFPANYITEAILVMTLLKIGMCAFTCGYYLHKHHTPKTYTFVLALAYGLSSYAVVQCMNIMWIDAVYLFPLLILGVERLIDDKKYLTFFTTLLFLFISNYYIAYMCGLIAFVYFIYYLCVSDKLTTNKERLSIFMRFSLYTLSAVLICAWLLIPTYYSLTLGKTSFTVPDFTLKSKFDILDFFTKLLPSTYDSVNIQGFPFVYSSLFTLLVMPLYFLNQKISKKAKVGAAVLLLTIVLFMNISWIDLALHGFQNPNWLNYRYAFVFPFFVIIFCGVTLSKQEGIQSKHIWGSLLFIILLMALIQKLDYEYIDDLYTITLGLICLVVYALFICSDHDKNKALVTYVFIVFLILELFSSTYTNLKDLDKEVLYSTRESYIPYFENSKLVYHMLENQDPGFYRTEKTYHRTVNDPMSIGMRGISHSTSTLNAKAINLIKRLGYSADAHWTKYLGGTPLSDSVLGIKYIMAKDNFVSDTYTLDFMYDGINVFKNPNALSIINAISSDLKDLDMENITLLELQNDLLSKMLGMPYTEFFEPVDDYELNLENTSESQIASHYLYREIDGSLNAQLEFEFYNTTGKDVYAYFPSSYPREVNMWLGSEWLDTYYGNETYRIFNLGKITDKQKLIMTIINSEVYLRSDVPYFYTFNDDLFASSMKALQANSMNITKYSETYLSGDIDVSISNPMIYTSIPSIKGWTVYVDGNKVKHYEIMDGLIGFDIDSGKHHIEMKYEAYGFKFGLALGVLGLILLICLQYKDNDKFKLLVNKNKKSA